MTKFLNNADIKGYIAQTAVTSYLIKADSTGRLVAAIAGTDYQAPTTALLPTGGTAGQILSKIDGTNYNTQWIDNFAQQLKHDVKLGATIAKGKAVYVSSANGTNMIVSAASNASEATSSKTLGLLETGGVTNDTVKVITEGLLAGLDTSTATAGDPVWLGTSGNLIFGLANKPVAPAHMVFIGIVTRAQSVNGEIFVKVQNGFELDELHNVGLSSVANNEGLFYDSATSLWKNKTIAAVLGYTPANGANYLPLTGGTLTGDLTLSGTNPRLYFTDTDNNPDYFISNTDGTFTVYDVTNSVGRFKIYTTGNAEFTNNLAINGGTVNTTTYTSSEARLADGSVHLMKTSAAGIFEAIRAMNLDTTAGTTVRLVAAATSDPFNNTNGGKVFIDAVRTSTNMDLVFSLNDVSGAAPVERVRFTGAGNGIFVGSVTASSFIKSGGTSAQFLKADGSVDSSTYLTTGAASSTYLPLSGGTLTGALNGTSATFSVGVNTNRSSATGSNPFIWNTAGVSDWFLGSSPLGTSTSDLSLYSYGTSSVVLNIARSTGAASFAGSLTTNGTFSFAATGNVSFTSNDANNYPRFTGNGASAQIGLFRASDGGMYIGGSANGFRVYDSSFNVRLLINQNGDTAFNSTTFTVGGNQVLHAGNYTSYAVRWNSTSSYGSGLDNTTVVPNSVTLFDGYAAAVPGYPSGANQWWVGALTIGDNNRGFQIAGGYGDSDMYFRKGNTTWGTWRKVWTDANLTNLNQLTNGPGYITSYTETDTLATVTGRGASTSTTLNLDGRVNIGNGLTRPSALNSDASAHARIGGADVHLYIASLGAGGGYKVAVQAARTSDFQSFDLDLQSNGGTLRYGGNEIATRTWVTSQAYITGYTETDTLATVTGRGASTSTNLSFTGILSFGSATRQMINVWGTQYGIGVQSSTQYFRSDSRFSWHRGGTHSDTQNDPGTGGTVAMTLDGSSNLTVAGYLRTAGITNNTVFWAAGAQNADFGNVLGQGTSSRSTMFRGNGTSTSVWWGGTDGLGNVIPFTAIDATSGEFTFWRNSGGVGGGDWTRIMTMNASGLTINSGAIIANVDSSGSSISAINNGNGNRWYGRITSFNSTSDKAAFVGTYASVAVVGAHNNALNAWANLYVNNVDGSNGGNVYLPTNSYVASNAILHAGNYSSYALPLSGGSLSGQLSINNGASNALSITTAVADGTTRDGIYLYENSGQASGRQAISWYNGGQSYYKARIWTEVGGGYGATQFGIDVANDARTVATRLYIRNGDVYINNSAYANGNRLVENTGTWGISITGSATTASRIETGNNQWTWSTGAHTATNPNSITLWDQYSTIGGSGSPETYGTILDIYGRSGHEHDQLMFGASGNILHRNCFYGTNSWNGWRTMLDSSNYSSYALPLSGGTMSGILYVARNLGSNDYTYVGQHNMHLQLKKASDGKKLELGVLDNGTGIIQANESGVGYYTLALNPVSGTVTINSYTALHAGNYNSYSPTLTGGGASGNWNINVTGNANNITQYSINQNLATSSNVNFNTINIADGNVELYKSQTIDMSGGAYSTSNYYPVIIGVPTSGVTIQIQNNLNSNVPSWSTHGAGFSINLTWTTNGSGWGTTSINRSILQWTERFASVQICGGITQMSTSSQEVVWLRGGGVYYFIYSRNISGFPSSTTYTNPYNTESAGVSSSVVNSPWSQSIGKMSYGELYSSGNVVASGSYTGNVSGSSYGSIKVAGTNGGYSGIYLSDASSTVVGMYDTGGNGGNWDSSTGWHFYWHRGNTCLGLGGSTTSSSYRVLANGNLRVDGMIYSSNYIQTSGAIYAAADITAYYSDGRLKENVKVISSALDKLNKIGGYSYTANDLALELKAAVDKKVKLGVIAQEVKDIFPEVIEQAPFDRDPVTGESVSGENYMTVKYERFVPILIQAIKEQQVQIESLKSIIDDLTK